MKFKLYFLLVAGLFAAFLASASELSDRLRSPDYVLLMRHTRAPGIGDPVNYSLDDCKSQRNLSEQGRAQAKTIGGWLKKQGVRDVEIHTSPWCRCKETAELLGFGQFKIEPSLASFFDEMQYAKDRTESLQSFISERLQAKHEKALILVTHHVNIFEFMGENIASGDMVLAKVDANGKMISYKIIPRPTSK